MRVLVIEDEEEIAAFVKKGLEAKMFIADVANNGLKGECLALARDYGLAIIDINLPKKDGLSLCKSIRKEKKFPIIMLSAERDIETKVKALDSGADDYVVKPFSMKELMARVNAVLRRHPDIGKKLLVYKDISLDPSKHIVVRGNKRINLRKKEFILLAYFMKNAGMVLPRNVILNHVWETNSDPFTNTLEVHITGLRKKLNEGFNKKHIHTVHGIGYEL